MKINPEIFRAYDIRGIYPQELNEDAAYLIGQAFVKFLKKPRSKIVVGRDNRLSSPVLHKRLIKGVTEAGSDVIDIGLSTSPMFYFAVAYFGFDGGINITASHNPPKYNGFKMVREKAIPISEETGLKEISNLTRLNLVKLKGRAVKKEIVKDYIAFNLKEIAKDSLKPFKIVIDTANAVSGMVIPEIFKKLPCKISHLFKKSDGSFPNHPPDPHVKKNLKELQKQVLNKKADLGIAFDGDGDRIIFINEKGEIVGGDLIAALIVSILLKNKPGEKIFYDIRSSRVVKEVIKNAGGKVVTGRLGHSFIKEKMRKENILFAGEFNGHYYLRSHYFCETPFFVLFKVLEAMSETRKNLSDLIKPFQKYFRSEEINFKIKNKTKKIIGLEKHYQDGKISHLDGLRVDFPDWWFSVRPSNTEDLLRLNLEAETKGLMEEKKKELLALINSQGNAIAR